MAIQYAYLSISPVSKITFFLTERFARTVMTIKIVAIALTWNNHGP